MDHGVLLDYEEEGQIDAIAIAEKPGIILQGAGAYLRKLRNGPKIYYKPLVAGIKEQDISG